MRNLSLCALLFAIVAGCAAHDVSAEPQPALLLHWSGDGTELGQLLGPRGIAIGPDHLLYVVDSRGYRIQKFTQQGVSMGMWGTYGTGPGQFRNPVGIAIGLDGTVYVSDAELHRVTAFTAEGSYLFQLPQQWINGPQQLAIDGTGFLYVANAGAGRIDKFNPAGQYAGTVAALAEVDAVGIDAAGNVYAVSFWAPDVFKFGPDGVLLQNWRGFGNDNLGHPTALAMDGADNVYVVGFNSGRVQKFENDGTYLTQWGADVTGRFTYPYGLAVDGGGNVYVSDESGISKFGWIPVGTRPSSWGTLKSRYRGAPGAAQPATGR